MPTLAQIRAAIVAKVGTVPNIGQVNDHEPYAKNQSEIHAKYVANISGADVLRGWFVAWRGVQSVTPGEGRWAIRHRWELRGFHALDEAAGSEIAFDNLCEALRIAFQADESLGGVVSSTVPQNSPGGAEGGLQVTEKNAAWFAGVLCHAMRGRLITEHFE